MNYKKIYTYKIYKLELLLKKIIGQSCIVEKLKRSTEINDEFLKKKKYHQTERSFRVGENKFSPRWSRSWWTKPVVSGFIFPFEPRSRTSCVWTMHRAKKFAWMARKSGEFPSFSPWSVFPRPRIAPRASLVTRKNKRDQLAASRLKSENWEERGGGRRPPSGRANFLRFWKAPPRSPLFFFLFSFQRNVIGCCARGNFMKLPDFWPGSNFTKIWNSIRRRDSITRVISLRSFVNKNFRSREKLV